MSNIFKFLITGDPKDLRYKFLKSAVSSDGYDKIGVALAFDTVEIIQFKDEKFPRLLLRSDDPNSDHVLWERAKDKKLCNKQGGLNLDTGYTRIGNGWCRFSSMESSLSDLIIDLIKKRASTSGRFSTIADTFDPAKKLDIMKDIVETMLQTPYRPVEDCDDDDCWTASDINKMPDEAELLLRGLNEFYLRKR